MTNLQVKNIPARLHRRLRKCAHEDGRTIRDIVLEAVAREIAHREFSRRLATREPVELKRSVASALDEVRSERGFDGSK